MPTIEATVQLTVEHLLTAVKQLTPEELQAFMQQLAARRQENEAAEEAALLAVVEENSRLPGKMQRRFETLRRKLQAETATKSEVAELQKLWRRVEQMNVTRLEALVKLADRRGTDIKTLMGELGLDKKPGVF
jgi:hypothetical protein